MTIEAWLRLVVRRRGLVLVAVLAFAALGGWSWRQLPIDAVPDITNVQVQINTEAPGHTPLESEQRVTYPVENAMAGLPRLAYTRSISRYGLSQVTVVFADGTDVYFARQLVSERLAALRSQLPPGLEPQLGPIATGLGEIFMYTVESESAGTETVPFTLSETSDAMATALLKLQEPLGEQRINNMTKTDAGLECRYEISAMGQTFKVIMRLALKDGKLEGQIEDEGGIFSIPVHGVRKGQGDSVAGAGASDSQRAALSGRPARQRQGAKSARGTVAGQRLELNYGELLTSAPGMNRIPFSQTEGYIWAPGKNGATKIKTPASLDFGGKVIPPGRYGLWTKRTKDGWNLIVNEFPDVWSTQHEPSADLAEVPMKVGTLDTPSETLEIRIEEQDGGGVIKIEFGSDQLIAPFKVVN